jgi:hypothetical protein
MPAPSHAPTVVIENFYPCLEGGRHPIKRVAGEPLDVWCDIFTDGHVVMSAVLKWRLIGTKRWFEAPMSATDNDRWHGQCSFESIGRWEYAVEAWSDTWSSLSVNVRASPHGMSFSRAMPKVATTSTRPSATASSVWTMRRKWASTSSTSHRSTRSASI